MSVKQYPFIDIAVHPAVRAHFSSGSAVALLTTDLGGVLWANGAAASLFGSGNIYDLLDSGLPANDVMTRQLQAAARQLGTNGEVRSVSLRIASGFRSTVVVATLSRIEIHAGEPAVLFAVPVSAKPPAPAECAARMISGFDDPDTHMAVLGPAGEVLAASSGFGALGLRPETTQALITAASRHPDRLVKRPISTGRGTLPAAIGRVSEDMLLLFAVETILGRLDPIEEEDFEQAAADIAPLTETTAIDPPADDRQPDADLAEAITFTPADTIAVEIDDLPGSDEDPSLLTCPPEGCEEAVATSVPADHAHAADLHDAELVSDAAAFTPDAGTATENEDAADGIETSDVVTGDSELNAPTGADDSMDTAAEDGDAATALSGQQGDGAGVAEDLASLPGDDAPADVQQQQGDADSVSDALAHLSETAVSAEETIADDAAIDSSVSTTSLSTISLAPASEPEPTLPERVPAFRFEPGGRAVRFVWKIDADGHFSEVSDEFAAAVGPQAGDVIGKSFASLAERFQLDPDGVITGLLQRRDTWSGKTVHWPIEGTGFKVPVDLAALPTYSRARSFDGFRGFGIVRVSDVIEDPQAIGLGLVPPETADRALAEEPFEETAVLTPVEAHEAETSVHAEPEEATDGTEAVVPEAETAGEIGSGLEPDDVMVSEPDRNDPEDPFRGERPALQTAREAPGGENVIPLSSIRQPTREPLTRGEQAAFREIARRLGEHIEEHGEQAAARTEEDGRVDAPDMLDADNRDVSASPEAGVPQVADDSPVADGLPGETDEAQPPAALLAADEPAPSDDEHATPAIDDHQDGIPADEPVGAEAFEVAAEENEAVSRPDIDDTDDLKPPLAHDRSVRDDGDEEGGETALQGTGLDASLLDALPVALLVHNGDSLFHANPEFLNLTGYESLAALEAEGGLDALFAAPEDDEEDLLDGTMQLIRPEGRLIAVTARLRSIRWHEGHALLLALAPAVNLLDPEEDAPLGHDDAQAALVSLTPVEESEGVQASVLRTEVDELRSILETATDGVVILGTEGDIRSLNRSASALFNYDETETRGKPFAMLFAHESQRAVMDYITGLSGHGVASVLNDGREVIGREASGGFIPLFMTMGRLSASNGFCAVIRDITQWKRTEEELRSAKRAAETANAHKSEFLARVSHEIRTPLNAIIGFSDMMASEHFGAIGNPRYVEYASDIGRSGRHVLDIVNDLLDISKIEAGEMELEFSAVELNEAIAEAVSIVQPQANAQRVIIRTSLSGAVPQVVADQRSIKQIALNILSNAIRFTPSGGQIVVSCAYESNGSVILRIRDTGIGMTRGELEQAMKPFRQVTTGARKRGDGTGLGLPLTKAMAEANRAQFSITSAPNEGTLVEITFPSQRVLAD